MPRKKEAEGHGGGAGMERWLLTYADLITLLLIFFIIMYAMSKVDTAKFSQLVQMLTKSFGGQHSVITMSNMGLLPQNAVFGDTRTKQRKLYVKTVGQLQKEIASKSVKVTQDQRGIVISLASDFYFGSGIADFGDSTEAVLKKLYAILGPLSANIRIEGHTDDVPIVPGSALSQRYPTNWELSSQRSVNVLKALEKLGLDRKRMAAAAYADTRPLKSNDTPDGRNANRRVEIVILSENGFPSDMPEAVPPMETGP
jgi:Flagellar motor protein